MLLGTLYRDNRVLKEHEARKEGVAINKELTQEMTSRRVERTNENTRITDVNAISQPHAYLENKYSHTRARDDRL